MKHLCQLLLVVIPAFAQAQTTDTLFYERFETGGTGFTLNSADQGGVSAAVGYNQWVINNEYTGGNGSLNCSGFPTTFTVPNTSLQPPATTGGPTTNYMHMTSDAAEASGIFNCSYLAANGLCGGNESYFSRMSQDVNTTGFDSVNFSFIWLCAGGQNIYGELYYSTDSGTSWAQVTTPVAQFSAWAIWVYHNVSLPVFANQPTLRFGFRFVNNVSLIANDPGFGIDEVLITASTGSPEPVAAFSVTDSTICEGTCVDFTDLSANNPTSWFWVFPGSSTSFSSQQHPAGICYNTPGTYDVTLIVENSAGTDTLTVSTITVFANPAAPVITASADTLFATPGFASYVWSLDGVVLSGMTSDTLITLQNGYYTVAGTDSNGCSAVSSAFLVNTGIHDAATVVFHCYPNPVTSSLFFESEKTVTAYSIYDYSGRIVLEKRNINSLTGSVDVSMLAKGSYFAKIEIADGNLMYRAFVK